MMRNGTKGSRGRPALLALGLLLASAPADAQWTRMPPPDGSPYWWTLSDDVSPSELRRSLQDRALVRQRFRRGAERGHHGDVVTEQQIYEVSSYINGRLYPELIPMYLAFHSFADGFERWPGWREAAPTLLREHGVSQQGARALLAIVPRYEAAKERIISEVTEPVRELMNLLRPLVDEVGNDELVTMLVEEDFSGLARLTGRDEESLARLHAAWKRQPIADAALPALVELRKDLSVDDWNAFRSFLLAEVASSMMGTDDRGDQSS